jgi:hypothetical protein
LLWLLGRFPGSLAECARLWRAFGQRTLHRIVNRDPAAFCAGNRTADHDQSALWVGLHHTQVLRRDVHVAHMSGHLLAPEHLARVLALAGRAVAPVTDRNAVRGTQTAEVVALHDAGKAFADGRARHVDILSLDEMVSGDLGAHLDQIVGAHAELCEFPLGLDIGNGESSARRARQPLHLGPAGAELNRCVAVLLLGALADNLAIVEAQHRHRDVLAGIGEDPGHADLLRDDT